MTALRRVYPAARTIELVRPVRHNSRTCAFKVAHTHSNSTLIKKRSILGTRPFIRVRKAQLDMFCKQTMFRHKRNETEGSGQQFIVPAARSSQELRLNVQRSRL